MWAAAWRTSSIPVMVVRSVVLVCSTSVRLVWWWQRRMVMTSLEDVLHRDVGWHLGISRRSQQASDVVVAMRAVSSAWASLIARVSFVHAWHGWVGAAVEPLCWPRYCAKAVMQPSLHWHVEWLQPGLRGFSRASSKAEKRHWP